MGKFMTDLSLLAKLKEAALEAIKDIREGKKTSLNLKYSLIETAITYVGRSPVTAAPGPVDLELDEKKYIQRKGGEDQIYVLFADVDNFSTFNDKYGHDVGDEVLRSICELGKRQFRGEDISLSISHDGEGIEGSFYHLHGEESAAVYMTRNLEDAIMVAERFRNNIDEESELECGYNVTVTVGLTRLEEDEGLFDALKRADRIMKTIGKKSGKNRVEYRSKEEFEE